MKKVFLIPVFLIFSFLILFSSNVPKVNAFTANTQDNVTVSKDQVVQGTYYAAGNNIIIDGVVNGDLVCGGQNITINGNINGDLLCAGQYIEVNGSIEGSIRAAGQIIKINGNINRNVTVFGQNITLGTNSIVSGDMLTMGQQININGKINKDLYGSMQDLVIAGTVGQNVNIVNQTLTLNEDAIVNGDLSYTSNENANIKNQQSIGGKLTHNLPKDTHPQEEGAVLITGIITSIIFSSISGIILGIFLLLIFRKKVNAIAEVINENPLSTFGYGLIATIISPILSIILFITVVGFPIGILLVLFWIILLIISNIFSAIYVGNLFYKYIIRRTPTNYLSLIIGIITITIIFNIPVIGWILFFASMMIGIGGTLKYLASQKNTF